MFSNPSYSSSSSSSSSSWGLHHCSPNFILFYFDSGQTTSFWPLWVQNDVVWISDYKPNQNNIVWIRFEITYSNDVILDLERSKRRRLVTIKNNNTKAYDAVAVEKKQNEKKEEAMTKGGGGGGG